MFVVQLLVPSGGVGVLVALCAGGDGGEGGGCGDGGEGGRGDGRSVCMGAVVLVVSLMSALRHRTIPCIASPNVFSPSPPMKSSSRSSFFPSICSTVTEV